MENLDELKLWKSFFLVSKTLELLTFRVFLAYTMFKLYWFR